MTKKDDQVDDLVTEEHEMSEGDEDTVEMEVSNSAMTELEEELAQAKAKADESWDKMVRATAELDNIRRRSERELENAHKYALEKFLHELLPIKDSLEMGLVAAQNEDADVAKLREGSELILKMLRDALDKFGIEEIDPMGHPFDPEHHQAMSMLESPDHEPNTVMVVMQKGYKLNDRLVRPAMVTVAKQPEGA